MYIDLVEIMRLKGRLTDISSEIDATLKNVNNELDTVCSIISSDNLIEANNSIKEKMLGLSTNLVNNLNKLTEFMGTQLENYTVSYQEAESALQSLVNHLNTQYRANGVISYDTTSVVESASSTAIAGAAGIAGLGVVSAGAMYSPNYVTTDYSMGSSGNHNVGVSSAHSNGMGAYTTYFPNSSTSINEFFSNSGSYTTPATPATATTLSATKNVTPVGNNSNNNNNSTTSKKTTNTSNKTNTSQKSSSSKVGTEANTKLTSNSSSSNNNQSKTNVTKSSSDSANVTNKTSPKSNESSNKFTQDKEDNKQAYIDSKSYDNGLKSSNQYLDDIIGDATTKEGEARKGAISQTYNYLEARGYSAEQAAGMTAVLIDPNSSNSYYSLDSMAKHPEKSFNTMYQLESIVSQSPDLSSAISSAKTVDDAVSAFAQDWSTNSNTEEIKKLAGVIYNLKKDKKL